MLLKMNPLEKSIMKAYQGGFHATVYYHSQEQVVYIGLPGTDIGNHNGDFVSNFVSDIEVVITTHCPARYQYTKEFFKEVQQEILKRGLSIKAIELGGHSLSGIDVQLLAADNPSIVAITFDSPGAREFLPCERQNASYNNITNVIIKDNVINQVKTHIGHNVRLCACEQDEKKLSVLVGREWLSKTHGIETFVNAYFPGNARTLARVIVGLFKIIQEITN